MKDGAGPQWKDGETQERSSIMELGRATDEAEVHTYAVVGVDTSIDGIYSGALPGTRYGHPRLCERVQSVYLGWGGL